MRQPRGDSRGILHPTRLRRHVDFRRHLPAPALRRHVEHYWLLDWDLTAPFAQHVVPHPAVNVVFQRDGAGPARAEVSGVGLDLFTVTLTGVGAVSGVQFRPGGFRPFWPGPVAELTGRRLPFAGLAGRWPPITAATPPGGSPFAGTCDGTDTERCLTLDDLLTSWAPAADPVNDEVVGLVEEIRGDRTVLRVDDFARRHGQSTRRLQRLFLTHVGVGPKWVIRRYRLHEAIERAAGDPPDWATLAADLGYSDQAHLVRDFTAAAGVPPAAYARAHT